MHREMELESLVKENLAEVESRIQTACVSSGRLRSEVTLMAVTKTHPPSMVDAAALNGLLLYGENRVQEGAVKRPEVSCEKGRWELIGPLQSNKARLALTHFDRIQTVDRPKILHALDRLWGEIDAQTSFPVLLQVNTGRDPRKAGCAPEATEGLLGEALQCAHLKVEGLMTIGPLSDDPDVARAAFAGLRDLRDDLEGRLGVCLPELSMGMTGDLEIAIAEGSTLIRVGSALFGTRD